MTDTFDSISRAVLLRNPVPGLLLSQDYVRNAFRRLAERRRWSWLIKNGQILVPKLYNTGVATVTFNSPAVTGQGTNWTGNMVGTQFRIGSQSPIYDIQSINSTTSLTLTQPWAGSVPTLVNVPYQIYQCYFAMPANFHAFVSVLDTNYNWQLNLNIDQREINAYDARRSNFQQAYVVSYKDLSAINTPRFELWPQNQNQYVYPYQYESRATDISDSNTPLPPGVRGDVLLEMCMGDVAGWPGSVEQPNPMFNLSLAQWHHGKAERMIEELERQDDEVWVQTVQYDISDLPYAPLPWGDSRWLQSHAV